MGHHSLNERASHTTHHTSDQKPLPKRRHHPSQKPSRSSTLPSINPLKSKIRDLTRVLEHDDNLPPAVRIEKERALTGYKQDLETAKEEKRKQAIIGRYHMVRFFERQKATRHLRKARKHLQSISPNTPDHAQAYQDVHVAEVDLNYTQYCPLAEKYEAIYPKSTARSGDENDAGRLRRPRPAMWKTVEECMEKGTLDALREGNLRKVVTTGGNAISVKMKGQGKGSGTVKKGESKARQEAKVDEDGESDGGFFEE